jgi:hypothetical protein
MAQEAKAVPLVLDAVLGLAKIKMHTGDYRLVVQIAHFVQDHRVAGQETKNRASQLLADAERHIPVRDRQDVKDKATDKTLKLIVEELNSV